MHSARQFWRASSIGTANSCDQHLRRLARSALLARRFLLAGNCLNRNSTENGSDQRTAKTARQSRFTGRRVFFKSITKMLLHVRALRRMASQRPQLALALAVTAGSAVSTVGALAVAGATQAAYQFELHASVKPLAPAPHPPTVPVFSFNKHPHLLPKLHANPLAGLASWYGSVWNGRKTASGEDFDESLLTAAHKTLPLGTIVRVTNLQSMRSVIVRINDRGTLAPNRVIDLSSAAAREIGMLERGLARVRLEVIRRG